MFEVIDHVQLVRVTGGAAQPAAQPPQKKQPASPQAGSPQGGQPTASMDPAQLLGLIDNYLQMSQSELQGVMKLREWLAAQLQGSQPQGDAGGQPTAQA